MRICNIDIDKLNMVFIYSKQKKKKTSEDRIRDDSESDTSVHSMKKSKSKGNKADEKTDIAESSDHVPADQMPQARASTSQGAGGSWYLDYSEQSEANVDINSERHEYPDIRKQIKAFAKSKLEKKYRDNDNDTEGSNKKKYKKHDRGHKSSNNKQ